MVILKGGRNGACIIHSAASLIFPLIFHGKGREEGKKSAGEGCDSSWRSLEQNFSLARARAHDELNK